MWSAIAAEDRVRYFSSSVSSVRRLRRMSTASATSQRDQRSQDQGAGEKNEEADPTPTGTPVHDSDIIAAASSHSCVGTVSIHARGADALEQEHRGQSARVDFLSRARKRREPRGFAHGIRETGPSRGEHRAHRAGVRRRRGPRGGARSRARPRCPRRPPRRGAGRRSPPAASSACPSVWPKFSRRRGPPSVGSDGDDRRLDARRSGEQVEQRDRPRARESPAAAPRRARRAPRRRSRPP